MEQIVSSGIINSYFKKLNDALSIDVAVVGGGPSGLVASTIIAKKGFNVALFERKLAPGGGMWGGAMMFNEIIVQHEAIHILNNFNINYKEYKNNYYVVDSIEATSALIYNAAKTGVKIFNCISVEDLVIHNNKVTGLVINWTPVHRESLHIDPLIIIAKYTIDSTGHDCELAKTLERKNNVKLNTPTGKVMGERSLSIDEAEKTTIDNTKEIFNGLYVCGMAANGVSGSFRMGPIFGGMLLSGEKVANLIIAKLEN